MLKCASITVDTIKKHDTKSVLDMLNSLDDRDKKFLALEFKYPYICRQIYNGNNCYIAKNNGDTAGFLLFSKKPSKFERSRPKGYTMVEEIAVSPKFRRQGVASALLNHYHSQFSNSLAKTNPENVLMASILERNGYTPDSISGSGVITWKRTKG